MNSDFDNETLKLMKLHLAMVLSGFLMAFFFLWFVLFMLIQAATSQNQTPQEESSCFSVEQP